jgi:hypothetical protein
VAKVRQDESTNHEVRISRIALLFVVSVCGYLFSGQRLAGALGPDGPESIEGFINKRLTVEENRAIFDVFALLNAGGYDDENSPDGMHSVRKMVREQISETTPAPLRQAVRQYYKGHAVDNVNYAYGVVAVATSGPPRFAFSKGWAEIAGQSPFSRLADLPALLREFHKNARLDSIYGRVRSEYAKAASARRGAVLREVAAVMEYCGAKTPKELAGNGEVKRAIIVPNLLESYEAAFSFVWDDIFYSVEGPQRYPGYNPHEFVHSITNPLSYDPKYQQERQGAARLFETARRLPDIGSSLTGLDAYFDENLVRAISLKYLEKSDSQRAEKLHKEMMQEYRQGYILERFFYEELSDYERSGQPLRLYYSRMLSRLDAENELKRWERAVRKD